MSEPRVPARAKQLVAERAGGVCEYCRSTLLRQVLEKELKQSQRFERLALALNALYPDGSDERRMLDAPRALRLVQEPAALALAQRE